MFGVEHGPVFERNTILASSQPECQGTLLIQITEKVFFLSFLNNNITISCKYQFNVNGIKGDKGILHRKTSSMIQEMKTTGY